MTTIERRIVRRLEAHRKSVGPFEKYHNHNPHTAWRIGWGVGFGAATAAIRSGIAGEDPRLRKNRIAKVKRYLKKHLIAPNAPEVNG